MNEGWRDARGIWRCRGYGRVLEIGADIVRSFDTTSESCLEIGRWSLNGPVDAYDRLAVRGDLLSLFEPGGITCYDHDRIGSVPTSGTGRDSTDPAWNFDVFWHAFDEQYAFFDEGGAEWNRIRHVLRPRAEGASGDELVDVLAEGVQTLSDAHVELEAGDRTIASGDEGERQLATWWQNEADPAKVATGGFNRAVRELTLHELGVRDARQLADHRLVVGEIDEITGYIAILAMWGYADDATQSQDARAAGEAIDRALGMLSGKQALVVDVRTNGGGWDAVSLALAARFAARARVAFTKRARDGAGYTERQSIMVEPAGASRFLGPVALLVSGSTGSAAEIFTLCMRVLPNVTTIGTPTWGILSDELPKYLPNGWVVTVSNERYESPAGICFERVGIPPDLPVVRETGESLAGYMRRGVEVAAEMLEVSPPGLTGSRA